MARERSVEEINLIIETFDKLRKTCQQHLKITARPNSEFSRHVTALIQITHDLENYEVYPTISCVDRLIRLVSQCHDYDLKTEVIAFQQIIKQEKAKAN